MSFLLELYSIRCLKQLFQYKKLILIADCWIRELLMRTMRFASRTGVLSQSLHKLGRICLSGACLTLYTARKLPVQEFAEVEVPSSIPRRRVSSSGAQIVYFQRWKPTLVCLLYYTSSRDIGQSLSLFDLVFMHHRTRHGNCSRNS